MRQIGRRRSRVLGTIIPAPERHRIGGKRLHQKRRRLFSRKRPTLQDQAALRGRREAGPITGIHATQVTLGVHMHADGLKHCIGKPTAQKGKRQILVPVIATRGRGRCRSARCQQMPEVMQQGSRHQLGRSASALGEVRTLQCMLLLGDRLATVLRRALHLQQADDVVYREGHNRCP